MVNISHIVIKTVENGYPTLKFSQFLPNFQCNFANIFKTIHNKSLIMPRISGEAYFRLYVWAKMKRFGIPEK